jgi:hypothetical protein
MKSTTYIRLSLSLFLSAILFSCDKDNHLSDNPTTGDEVFIQIHAPEITENDEIDLARASSQTESDPKPEPTSLGDGFLLEMSMEEDESSPLRAEKSLVANAYFRVIAVRAGTGIYISHGDFQQGGATSLPDFHVTANTDYDFICFSYNKTTNTLPVFNPTRYDDISGIDLSGDMENLLWQKKNMYVGTIAPSLSFLLNYKVAQVRIVVNCVYNGWTITNIANTMQLSSVALPQSANLLTGDPSGGSAETKTVTWPTLAESTQQTSNPLIIMPTAAATTLTVTIPVNLVTRKNLQPIPTIAATGKFTKKLDPGRNYKLIVKLKAAKFAGSNIYHNGSTLTFDLHGNTTNQGYQGVYFKFGSLMGLPGNTSFVANSTQLYKPGGGTQTYSSWANVPSTPAGTAIGADNITVGTGDICRYLGTINSALSGYRLPSSSDYGVVTFGSPAGNWNTTNPTTTPVIGGWVKGVATSWAASNGTGVADGRVNLIPSHGFAKNLTMNGLSFPATGYYFTGSGGRDALGTWGFYQTNSVIPFEFNETTVGLYRSMPDYGYPVRCVKND